MNGSEDITALTGRVVAMLVIIGIFYFVLKSKKKD